MQESARRSFKEIKIIDKDSNTLTQAYQLPIRSFGVIWINYMLLSCYCHHKSNLLDADKFDLAR